MKRGMIVFALGAVCALALTACGGGGAASSSGGDSTPTIEGKWKAEDPRDAYLEFGAPDGDGKGSYKGKDGCNSIAGTFTMQADNADVKQGPSTLMACPGVNDWLSKIGSLSIAGDNMTVKDDKGKEIGTLTRAD
ncbi:META domain-containing protein [Brevibacterium sp. 91QC2O2]|uniref:META domain-containing protein n=1 Tax=Brevibacterium sp. 91QC2O2 TaxID=2968458 RepID=UPI00211B9E62|nr:META domain-containing protein [Brevibacterium sp. 91QC2O2]MCQ9367062.1 META domain-containing protein [Brevibacterium sp. 91QC2O2]